MKQSQMTFLACLLLVPSIVSIRGDEPERVAAPRDFMRMKLIHSQKILEGLVREDYAVMAKQAQDLSSLSLDASWQVIQTPEYKKESLEFRRTTDVLTTAAKKQDLDAATSAYAAVTKRCVVCHKYVRSVQAPKLK